MEAERIVADVDALFESSDKVVHEILGRIVAAVVQPPPEQAA